MKIFLVIPTIRSLNFLNTWKDSFRDCHILIVEDGSKKTIRLPSVAHQTALHVCWKDIHKDFGEHEWIFSRKNAGIRSYGFWKAHTLGADIIVTIDDDCYPTEDHFIQKHIDNLQSKSPNGWFATFPHPDYMYTRGFPYKTRNMYKTVMSHGLWSNKMDMDAQTQLRIGDVNIPPYPPMRQFVPRGHFFPMSSMNLAFNRVVTPLMYFPLMGIDPKGKSWGYDRFDDIWAGLFAKKIIDHLGWSVANGSPFVEHKKASAPHKNLIKEKSGRRINEIMWKIVDDVVLSKKTPVDCYEELAHTIRFPKGFYFDRLKEAMMYWSGLFYE